MVRLVSSCRMSYYRFVQKVCGKEQGRHWAVSGAKVCTKTGVAHEGRPSVFPDILPQCIHNSQQFRNNRIHQSIHSYV